MMISGRAYINQEKCIECGRCKTVCQFNAISDVERPCRRSCPVNAIEMDENSIAKINYDKCISCGHCVLSCPFGAITDRSFIYNVAEILSQPNNECYALIAPSISSQFDNTTIGQITTGLKQIGFKDVVEVALGADMVIKAETEEYQQRIQHHDFLTTSCCPAFVNIIEKEFPELKEKMSSTVSPMIALARLVKTISPKAKTVFIGPCIAKKDEANRPALKGDIDYVLTFEELRSLFGAKDISLDSLKTTPLDNASRQARLFAIQGGVSSAIKQYIDDQNIDTIYDPIVGNGALECIKLLKLGKFNKLTNSFIEGMACEGGCISGPGSITHRKKDMSQVKKYAYQAKEKTTQDALSVLNVDTIEMHR
jgi:[FeFe] hydrogenase (group B1/B3)